MRCRLNVLHAVLVFVLLSVFQTKELHAQNPENRIYLPTIVTSSNGKTLEQNQLTESEELVYERRLNNITELLTIELEKVTEHQYAELKYEWISQDDEWMYGYILAKLHDEAPADIFNFLARTVEENTSVALIYSEQFDEWVDILPESIIELEGRKFLYSSKKHSQISGLAPDNVETLPKLSFPWKEGSAWRFSSGPHHQNGPGYTTRPWSGIDFGIPYSPDGSTATDQTVVTALGGGVLAIEKDCSVTIGLEHGWAIRYLHIKEITAGLNQSIDRGTPIAKVPLTGACGSSSGPHLHIDLLKDGVYQDFNNQYIGGWQIKEGSSTYQGSLHLSFLMKLNANTSRSGSSASYVRNMGAIGDDWFANFTMPSKYTGGVNVCNANSCYLAAQGTTLIPTSHKDVNKLFLDKGYKVEFRANTSFVSTSEVNSTAAAGFSCLDFDITDLQNYTFPSTEISLRDNSTEIIILQGTCNPSDRPVRKGSTTGSTEQPGTGTSTSTNYGCSNQTTGIKFHNNSGSCFYMTAGKASLPFSPTRIEVLDANRKYDITICNAKDQCDEFNNTASIDHSSVQRPFTRVEVTPQGLVSSDAVASCKTSTGRKVEFATLQAGVKYYTDRSYTVKNIDKHELIGMRFLKTPNDDKANKDPEYITCDIKNTTQIVIAVDGRRTNLPGWMKNSNYTRIDREIGVTDDDMQHFDLFACTQKAGYKLRLGGPLSDGASGIKSNYIIVFRDAAHDKATDCSAKFNVPPDVPVFLPINQTDPLYNAPLLEWKMSDRNSGDILEAFVSIWKDDLLVSTIEWLPSGVTQWVPIWNEPGNYKARVTIRDKSGIEVSSTHIAYTIVPTVDACVAAFQ